MPKNFKYYLFSINKSIYHNLGINMDQELEPLNLEVCVHFSIFLLSVNTLKQQSHSTV